MKSYYANPQVATTVPEQPLNHTTLSHSKCATYLPVTAYDHSSLQLDCAPAPIRPMVTLAFCWHVLRPDKLLSTSCKPPPPYVSQSNVVEGNSLSHWDLSPHTPNSTSTPKLSKQELSDVGQHTNQHTLSLLHTKLTKPYKTESQCSVIDKRGVVLLVQDC